MAQLRTVTASALRFTLLLSIVATCGDLDTFTVEESATTTIQGATLLEQLVGDIGFDGFLNFDLTQSTELQNQGVTREQIDSVRITSLTLTITDPPGGDFTFLDSLAFFAEAEGETRQRIAHGGPFTSGAAQVSLTLDDVDLAPYAAAPSMSITTEATGRRPSQTTTIDATMALEVDINISGVVCGG